MTRGKGKDGRTRRTSASLSRSNNNRVRNNRSEARDMRKLKEGRFVVGTLDDSSLSYIQPSNVNPIIGKQVFLIGKHNFKPVYHNYLSSPTIC